MATKAEIESITRVLAAKDNQIEELGSQLKEARRAADKTYNGWTNYATWRVNLEVFDGFDPSDYFSAFNPDDIYGLGESLKEYAEQVLFECSTVEGLARDYALAFLSDVNWQEIAKHLIATIELEA